MRIAYSCAGEGLGHAARMVALYKDLRKEDEIFLFVPETVQSFVKKHLPSTPFYAIPCFEFVKSRNKIQYFATALQGIRKAIHFIPTIRRLSRELTRLRIDVVLSDFEPYLPWAARMAHIPVVQMNHPGIVQKFLSWDPRSWLASLIARLMEGPWDKRILVSFYHGDVGPILRESLHTYPVKNEGFFVVNLKEDARKRILPLLNSYLPGQYQLFPAEGSDFDLALTHCKAVITNAGHQTISEALVLGKPILAVAQDGQYEQILNARMLEQSGRGLGCTAPTLKKTLPRFLQFVQHYHTPKILLPHFSFKNSRVELIKKLRHSFSLLARNACPVISHKEMEKAQEHTA